MIPLEVFLQLLDEERAAAIHMAENPEGRDGFALGHLAGMFRAVADIREKLNELVEQHNQQENER